MFTIKVRTGVTEFSVFGADKFKMGKTSEVCPGAQLPDGTDGNSMCIRVESWIQDEALVLRKGQEAFIVNENGRTIERLVG